MTWMRVIPRSLSLQDTICVPKPDSHNDWCTNNIFRIEHEMSEYLTKGTFKTRRRFDEIDESEY